MVTAGLVLGLLGIPTRLPFGFGNPRVRSNINIISNATRAGETKGQIQARIAQLEGRGIRSKDLGDAMNYIKELDRSSYSIRNLGRDRRFNPDRVPLHFAPMPQNYRAVMRVNSIDNFTGLPVERHYLVRFDDVLTPREMQELAREAFEADINQAYNSRTETYTESLQIELTRKLR